VYSIITVEYSADFSEKPVETKWHAAASDLMLTGKFVLSQMLENGG
jgi:hypothetical protein